MKKKLICLTLITAILVFASTLLCSCGLHRKSAGISIVATTFPQYDWVRNIVGDNKNIEIKLLQDSGVDLHSYQPTAKDIITLSECDIFIYVGGESDSWVEGALKNAENPDMVAISLLDALGGGAKDEELKEGMEAEEEAGSGDAEKDEHVWLSLKNASKLCKYIKDRICEIDPSNKDIYESNCAAYVERINELDRKFEEAVSGAKVKTVLFADRFPFRYFVDDYGLDYYAAFTGCSAESEASFSTIQFLVSKVDQLNLKSIIKLETSNSKIAETIRNSTVSKDQQILTMYSIQSVTASDISKGVTYLGEMEKNLETLKKALE